MVVVVVVVVTEQSTQIDEPGRVREAAQKDTQGCPAGRNTAVLSSHNGREVVNLVREPFELVAREPEVVGKPLRWHFLHRVRGPEGGRSGWGSKSHGTNRLDQSKPQPH